MCYSEFFDLFAYCLMSNHVHLFIKEQNAGDIKRIMHKVLSKVEKPTDIAVLEKSNRDRIIRKLNKECISIREIERFTGISRGVVYRAIKKA